MADALSVVPYGLTVVVAFWDDVSQDLDIGPRPLELEGIFVTGLLMIGISLAGAIFISTGPGAAYRDQGTK